METKEIFELLNSIITNDVQTADGLKSELMFTYNGKTFNTEEAGELISQMDVEQLDENQIEQMQILYRRLSNDDTNGNLFTNEDPMLGPLSQKITEYEHVVEDKEFQSNMTTLEMLKARNQKMSNVNSIHLSEKESDSKYNLDYVSVKVKDKVEMIPISDPDYLERFVNEYASDIADMTEDQFYSLLKHSTNSEIEFVELEKYNTEDDIKNKLNTPRIDEHMIGFESDEVKRLVEQFIPGTDIEIGIDKDGEVFYRAGDALLKGKDKDGHRVVEFVQQPGNIKNYVDDKVIDSSNAEEALQEAQNVGFGTAEGMDGRVGVANDVHFDPHTFATQMPLWKDILKSDDPEKKEAFLNQLDAFVHQPPRMDEEMGNINVLFAQYMHERMDAYKEMKSTGKSTYAVPMSYREFTIIEEALEHRKGKMPPEMEEQIEEMREEEEIKKETGEFAEHSDGDDFFGFDDDDYGTQENGQYGYGDVRAEDVDYDFNQEQSQNYDIDSFAQTDDVETYQETYSNANEETVTMDAPGYPGLAHKPRMRVRKKPNGMTAFVLLLEMLTVAMIIMMFLSLDI